MCGTHGYYTVDVSPGPLERTSIILKVVYLRILVRGYLGSHIPGRDLVELA